MPNNEWLSRFVYRGKRARTGSAPAVDQRQLVSPAIPSNAYPRPLPVSSHSFGESECLTVTVARSKNVASASLNPSDLAGGGASHEDRLAIQKGENLGLQVLYEPPAGLTAILDIIFVHGLTGNAYATWYSKSTQVHWPSRLLKEDIPDARILAFGYDANVVNWRSSASINRISNHGEALLGAVTRQRVRTNSESRNIIFVMHSLGGLVVQSALSLSRSSPETHLRKLEANTIGLAFLGTPHFGADLASWGTYCAMLLNVAKRTNKEIVQVLDSDSEVLATIQKRFHEILRLRQAGNHAIHVTCFYEELPMPVVGMIVDMKSAILPGYPSYGIHATHTDIPRFANAECAGYDTVVGELQGWAKIARQENIHTTELQEECLRGLYFSGLESREEAIAPALEGTFNWIWDEGPCDFLTWLKSGRGLYWISGRAASGKSTMMKYLSETSISKAQKHLKADDKPVVVAYFLDRSNKDSRAGTLDGIARAVLWQLLRQRASFFEHILPQYEEMKRSRSSVVWRPSELHAALRGILSSDLSDSIWLFLDALDEFPGDVVDIVDFCKTFAATASEKVRICVSSRPVPEVVHILRSDPVLEIEQYTREDIKTYTARELKRIEHIVDVQSRRKLAEAVSQRANGLFIWVRLVSRDIVRSSLSGTETHLLFDCLKHLRQEMNELYLQILQQQTDETAQNMAKLMLGIVACARRSLSLFEFQFILEQRRSDAGTGDLERRIDAMTGGLLEYRTGRLRFSHETVSAFVWALHGEHRSRSDLICQAHQRLAESCLLLLQQCEQPKPQKSRLLLDLHHYSILNWLDHWRAITVDRPKLYKHIALPKITNEEFLHWRRLYLARCWTQKSTGLSTWHPAATSLEFLILSVILDAEVFAHSTIKRVKACYDSSGFNKDFLDYSDDWSRHELDILVSIALGPGYSISVHARQMLVTGTDNMQCMIIQPDDARTTHSLAQLHLICSPKYKGLENTITFHRCKDTFSNDASKEDGPINISLFPGRQRLKELKILMQHNLQLDSDIKNELTDMHCISPGLDRLLPGHSKTRFATPLHYAAFYGLTLLIEELYKSGADVNHASKESQYGTPLLAAIWGIDTLGYNSAGINAIKALLRFQADPTLAGNGENLGVITPLSAAVKLYTGYKKRVGFGSDNMKGVIQLLIEEGVQADPATRAIARSSPELRRHFRNLGGGQLFGSFSDRSSISLPSSTPPIDIPKARSSYSSSPCATVGILAPLRTNTGSANHRLIQSVDDH